MVDMGGKVHKVMAYSIEIITAPTEEADLKPALEVFPEVKDLCNILRPTGNVDLLLGIQDANLHPYLAKPNKHCVGKLRLLTSRFGSGYLLDGSHPEIKVIPSYLSPAAREKTRANFSTRKGSKPPKVSHRTGAKVGPRGTPKVLATTKTEQKDSGKEPSIEAEQAKEAALRKEAIYEKKIAVW